MRVWTQWDSLHHSNYNLKSRKENQFITVIVIGRNEEKSIAQCLSSITDNSYPKDKFEIIYVDDHSEDETLKRVRDLQISQLHILKLSEYAQLKETRSFKKAGIQYALTKAKGDIIACTDADCIVSNRWLSYIDFGMQQELIKMLIMPVCFQQQKSMINRFQSLDMMATMAFTGYGIKSKQFYSANGANLAFRKSVYAQIDVHEEYASGDDMFLVQEVSKKFPVGIKFLKSEEVLVNTKAETTWTGLLEQRKRWATKAKGYSNSNLYKTQVYVFLFNAIIVINTILGLTLNTLFGFTAIFQLLVKGIMDYLLLINMCRFFKQQKSLKFFIISFLLFTPYILLMGIMALFGKSYYWKGRKLR